MTAKTSFCFLLLVSLSQVHSATIFERSYEYVMNLGKNMAPSLMSMFECLSEERAWECARERAGKILDVWEQEVDKQRQIWKRDADAEAASSGRSLEEMPSKLAQDLEDSLKSITDLMHQGVARALSRKHDSGGGIDSITISTGQQNKKKKEKKKKQKPAKIHLIHPVMMKVDEPQKGQHELSNVESRGILSDLWNVGDAALDKMLDDAAKADSLEDRVADLTSLEEQRGKKKKKKKAILKLLILGAVIKAKIGTILQILSYKLQLKFFLLALIGLGINLARLWIEIKNKHNHQPQKIIYYEHAQHQHHYDHEEEAGGWGPWSRSSMPEETADIELDIDNSPYRGQEKNPNFNHPRSANTNA